MAAVLELLDEKDSSSILSDNHQKHFLKYKRKRETSTSPFISQEDESTTLLFPRSRAAGLPCLPVSKGSIKKTAQTMFVNSSPRSYRLMPASVESSDKTSFVEKFPHSRYLPMNFMLEVAELWEVSKRSELECNFTLAKSDILLESDNYMKEAKKRSPICHSSIFPPQVCQVTLKHNRLSKVDIAEEISKAVLGRDLFTQVKRFLKAQELKERHPMGIAGLMKTELQPSSACQSRSMMEQSAIFSGTMSASDKYLRSGHKGNFPLTPLVKRLSVTGLEEVANCERTTGSTSAVPEKIKASKKSLISTKRPKSKRFNDREEEPLQKRAYCDHIQVEGGIQPG